MFRFWITLKKEFLILINDKTGLALMFVMPILMVYIITIIQDSAFKVVNENKISILIVNHDDGKESKELIRLISESDFFTISENKQLNTSNISHKMLEDNNTTGLIIPKNFSSTLRNKALLISDIMMEELALSESSNKKTDNFSASLEFYHDPVLQENYCSSIINIINAFVKTIEGDLLIQQICEQLNLKNAPTKLKEAMASNQIIINQQTATLFNNEITPNSTQHNVPAWTIFAIFFMVISLGNNIIKERLNGSFIRLKTMPTSFNLVLGAKLLTYLIAVFIQVAIIFSLAKLTFPLIGLPELIMPSNFLAFVIVVSITGLTAISFAMAVGVLASTQEQANGFGAVAIVIFAALGGIWVPTFVMPEYMKTISYLSPLHWCLDGFYTLFLRGGNWSILFPTLIKLLFFSSICFVITFFQLKKNKIV